MTRMKMALIKSWRWLREVTGDAAYDNYLRHCNASPSDKPMTRSEFYSDALRRKYSTMNRCC